MITCGVNQASNALFVGKTIEELKASAPGLAIPPKYTVVVNGDEVASQSSYKIGADDEIWIMPTAGKQG